MRVQQLRTDSSSLGENVVEFPRSQAFSSSSQITPTQFCDALTLRNIRSIIESRVIQNYLELKSRQGTMSESPFGSIYISELSPDQICPTVMSQLIAFKDIKDLSETIEFDDEWDD